MVAYLVSTIIMQQKSHRHHYIPEFLIKHFGDEQGQVYVYDKQTGRIAKRKQSAKSIFFEDYRNTVHSHGLELDDLEQLYTRFDTMFATDLAAVLKQESYTPEQFTSLVIMATCLKWRVPASDSEFHDLKENSNLSDLHIDVKITNEQGEILQPALDYLLTTDLFKQFKRTLLPLLPLMQSEEKNLQLHNNTFIDLQPVMSQPALLGDCPVIERATVNYNDLGDFILPLSSTHTLIYKANARKGVVNTDFYLYKDLTIFHTATRYVACKNKDRLENIAALDRSLKLNGYQEKSKSLLFGCVA
jgi:hypothetical protein